MEPEEEKDIIKVLNDAGYKTVEGMDEVLRMMEEMANQPKEEYGKRQPGERCMYEINRGGLLESEEDLGRSS
jgi:hypothetical protein